MNDTILQDLQYGVYVVGTTDENGKRCGCIANSIMQVTSTDATIAVSINHENYTNECIKKNNRFSVSILNRESDEKIIGTFGFYSSRDIDKYSDFKYEDIEGMPILTDTNGYTICSVISTLETKTHTIFLARVLSSKKTQDKLPMTYDYYKKELKGKSPKNAPTFVNDEKLNVVEEIKKNKWRCTVCGYIYEGELLPGDFRCPICGVPREMFEKVE